MINDPAAFRYAEALFQAAKSGGELPSTLTALQRLSDAVTQTPSLSQLLGDPGLAVERKLAILGQVSEQPWTPLTRAFLTMALSLGRAEILGNLAEAFRALVDEDQRRLRVTVRSARALPPALLKRLTAALEHRSKRTVEAETEIAPELLGGVQVVIGHRLIDGSIRRRLSDLRHQLQSVPVV